jgi:hypothetical protein
MLEYPIDWELLVKDLVVTGSGDGTAHVWNASALPDSSLRIHSRLDSQNDLSTGCRILSSVADPDIFYPDPTFHFNSAPYLILLYKVQKFSFILPIDHWCWC